MNTLGDNAPSLPVMLVYGLVILLYLVILRLLLNFLQQLGDKHRTQRSVIDRDIRLTMSPRQDDSMHAFDIYGIAIVIAKGGIAAFSMAAVIILLVLKVGLLATAILIIMVVLVAWTIDQWLKSREKVGVVREVRKYVQKAGSMGSVIMLSIMLVVLLFVMITLH